MMTNYIASRQNKILLAKPKLLVQCLGVAAMLIMVLGMSACGSFGKSKQADAAEPIVDMTRPPTTIKGGAIESESDPDETISFEKWKNERQEDE